MSISTEDYPWTGKLNRDSRKHTDTPNKFISMNLPNKYINAIDARHPSSATEGLAEPNLMSAMSV